MFEFIVDNEQRMGNSRAVCRSEPRDQLDAHS
jgi:hypothetical protein